MYKIKVSMEDSRELILRQSPGCKCIWRNYKFFINQEIEEADFWIVDSKGLKKNEECSVSPENTIFITGEPESVYRYSEGFVRQFNTAIVCQDTKHPKQIFSQPMLPWWVGKNSRGSFSLTYDDFKAQKTPVKTRLISIVSSNKAFTKGHQDRINFVKKLKDYYGAQLDVFGRSINPFDDKWDVISKYKYHISLENSSFPHYWTEKLSDSYLCETFPFYYGCPNIEAYFPKEAYRAIDIYNFERTVKVIDKALNDNLYENSLATLKDAKELVLDKYNLFPGIADLCDKMNPNAPKEKFLLKRELSFFDISKYFTLFTHRFFYRTKYFFRK